MDKCSEWGERQTGVMSENKNGAERNIAFDYRYIEDKAHELPCDLSESSFWRELREKEKLSFVSNRQGLANIIQSVSEDIFGDIYKNRSGKTTVDAGGEDELWNKQRNQFYGEAIDLLRAVIVAYDKNKGPQKENLAKKTFEELASYLSTKEETEIMQDYVFLSMLHNDCVKRSMLLQFRGELDKRLKTIKRLIDNQSLPWSANHLSVTLHRLDAIIVDLIGATQNIQEYLADNPDEDEYRGKASQSLNCLYNELLATRKRNSVRNKAGKTTKIKFELPQSEDTPNAEIISKIKDTLSSLSMEERTRRDRFFAVYREYLFASNKDNPETKDGEQFYQSYLDLKKYTGGTASLDEFEREVREELKRIAYRTFAPVISEDYIQHYYIETRFSHARYAFAYTQLINAQDQIRYKVHNALRLLSSTYTIIRLLRINNKLPFGNEKDIEEFGKWLDLRNQSIFILLGTELESQVNMIRLEREHLHSEYANVNLLRQYDQQSVWNFVQAFNESCPELFGTGSLISETLEALTAELEQTTDVLRILYIQSAFLQSECMMVIREEVENTVKELKKEYERYDSIK